MVLKYPLRGDYMEFGFDLNFDNSVDLEITGSFGTLNLNITKSKIRELFEILKSFIKENGL